MKKYGKRGQFYLIAIVIFTSLIIGFFTMSNTYKKETLFNIENNQQELETEIQNILEYGIYNELTNKQIFDKIENFLEYYVDNHKDMNFYFIYGENNNVTLLGSNKYEVEKDTNVLNTQEDDYFTFSSSNLNNNFNFSINNKDYSYELNNMNLYYIIIYEESGEVVLLARDVNFFESSSSDTKI